MNLRPSTLCEGNIVRLCVDCVPLRRVTFHRFVHVTRFGPGSLINIKRTAAGCSEGIGSFPTIDTR